MVKYRKIIIRSIFISLIPAVITYLATSNILDNLTKIGYSSKGINSIKQVICLINIAITFLVLTINVSVSKANEDNYHIQRDNLLKQSKEILILALQKELSIENLNLNIRLFVEKKGIISKLKNILLKNNRKEFIIKNIYGLGDSGITNNLKFEVHPKPQGLVGRCYYDKQMLFDDDLEK